MERFARLEAVAAPLPVPNVDTDQIVPARFLRKPRGEGFGRFLFHDLRFDDEGRERPGFVLNRPEWRAARILVAGRNFGCGSSREHAVYALWDYGIRAVVAPSFGDIFNGNALKNGLLPVVLPAEDVTAILAALDASPGARMTVDLATQQVVGPDGGAHRFEIDPFRKRCLLEGVDEIGFTLGCQREIGAFEEARRADYAWL